MAEGKEKAYRKRAFTFLHKLSRHIIDRCNVISIDSVPKTKSVSQKSRPKENWFIMECEQRPNPGANVHRDQKTINADNPVPEVACKNLIHVASFFLS